MLVIHNFSNLKHVTEYPLFDVMAWMVALDNLKLIGARTKLYCAESDLNFLGKWGLLGLYDEVDTDFLTNRCELDGIRDDVFWSVRKLLCVEHEFSLGTKDFVYMDVDVVPSGMPDFGGHDLVTWSPDPYGEIYVDWDLMSKPSRYRMPDYVVNANHAYNCGVLYFDDQKKFEDYVSHYMAFVRNNPCEMAKGLRFDDPVATPRNAFACNAEQRILAGLADHRGWDVGFFMDEVGIGKCENGTHYYILRALWRKMKRVDVGRERHARLLAQLNVEARELWSLLYPWQRMAFANTPIWDACMGNRPLTEYV